MIPIGVLVAPHRSSPGHPSDRPIGRAALALRARGVDVVFGHTAVHGRLTGVRATPDGWTTAEAIPVVAAYDRFPSQTRPADWRTLAAGLEGVPLANPEPLVLLCRDKVACQRVLEGAGLQLPPLCDEHAHFDTAVQRWGAAFLKPRYGAFGRGVRRVLPGDVLPRQGEGAVPGIEEPLFVQRAIAPLQGWAGVSLRVNVQRLANRSWHVNTPVVRRSRTDPVVNASRGAEVASADAVFPELRDAIRAQVHDVAAALSAQPGGELLVELGVDVVISADREPWVIEVNSRPRGRLEALAAVDSSWDQAHLDAVCRPIETLAAWFG